jgi:LPS-assembly protein
VLSIATPLWSSDEIKIDSIDAQIITTIDSNTLSLEGNVVIKTELLEFWSEKAIYNKSKKSIKLEGSIRVLSKNLDISAKEMEANLLDRTFYITDTSFSFMKKSFGNADSIRVYANEEIELLNTSLSSCSIEDPVWQLKAGSLTLLETGRNAVVRGVKLKIKEIPVLYIPYLRTAVGGDKFSGFLPPSLKQGRDGIDISTPYFFNLSSNYDLTVSPRYIEERGSGIAAEFRYLTETSKGNITTSNIFKDRKFSNETNYQGNRWMAQWFHRSQLGSSLFIDIHTEGVSDNFFFENLNEDILGTKQKNYLTKKVNAKWIGESLKFEGEIREYKDLNPFTSEQYETRPNFSLTFQNSYKGINFNLLSSYSKFAFDGSFNPFNKQKEITRKSIEPSLSYSKYFTSSSFSIAIGVEDLNYDVNSINFDRSSNWLETEYKLFFENRSDQSYKSLNPTFKFIVLNEESLLSESIDSRLMELNYNNLFLRNWYSGPDRFLNQDRLIVGIEHQNIGAENDTNLSLSIGKAFFLKDEYSIGENNKRTSPLVMEFKQQIKSNLFTNGTLEIDSDLDRVHSSSFGLMYERDEDKKIELRSVYKRLNPSLSNMPWFDKDSPISQLELLSQWSISDQFIIFGKLLKDNEMHKSKDLSFGFQYSNCCMKAGLMKRKWKDQDYYTWYASPAEAFKALESGINPELQRDNIYFFFELRDIGRIGKEISEVISSTMLE